MTSENHRTVESTKYSATYVTNVLSACDVSKAASKDSGGKGEKESDCGRLAP